VNVRDALFNELIFFHVAKVAGLSVRAALAPYPQGPLPEARSALPAANVSH
jgi:hypothetical protein